MSRIDEALRRLQDEAQNGRASAVGIAPEGTPDAGLFTPPWTLGTAAPAAPPPATTVVPPRELSGGGASYLAHRTLPARIHDNLQEKVVASDGMAPAVAEQYRKLGAKLHQLQLERDLKTLMVISAVPGEGKTLTSINLALTFSRSYKRKVLLIDADLRKPSIQDAFGMIGVSGLHEALLGETPTWSSVPVFDLGGGLSVLPAGRPTPDPMMVLTSDRMRSILAEAKREYDWVIIDTAPLAVLPDAHVLRDTVDAAVLVIQAGHTSYDLVERAIGLVGRDHIVGVVLNGVDGDEVPAAYAYGQYYGQR